MQISGVPTIDGYYLQVRRDFLTFRLQHADWASNRIRSHAALRGCISRVHTIPCSRAFCPSFRSLSLGSLLRSSLSLPCSSFVRYIAYLSRTRLPSIPRLFSDGALLTRILPRNYQEEEIVGRRYVVKRLDLEWKEGTWRLPTKFSDFHSSESQRERLNLFAHNVTWLSEDISPLYSI